LLTPWQGAATSIVWPAWSSGPFLCVRPIDPRRRNGPPPTAQIWQLNLPQRQADKEERTQLTREPANYFRILGAGADGYSLVAQRFLPPPGVWDSIVNFFANALAPQGRFQASLVTLTLKK
jgi:hypothetical protein